MSKLRKALEILNIIEYCVFFVSTLFVLVFQFTGYPLFVRTALVMYIIGFLLVFAIAVIQCIQLFNPTLSVRANTTKTSNADDKEQEHTNIKTEKTWAIIKAVASLAFAIFTLVVLILY